MLNTTLDFFVCLSSVVAISGNLGQSSYSGSNAFLDAFCRYRQQQGLPAVSVNLPAISEVGYVAEAMHTNKAKSLENFHAAAMTPAQFWSVLDSAIAMTSPRTGHGFFGGHIVAGLAALKDRNKMYQGSGPLLNLLYRATEARSFAPAEGSEQLGTAKSSLKHQLAGADFANDSAKAILFAGIAEKVSSILMVPPEDVTPEVSLEDLGLDSLIAVELRNWLVRELGVAISVIDIANSSSVGELSEKVTGRIVR